MEQLNNFLKNINESSESLINKSTFKDKLIVKLDLLSLDKETLSTLFNDSNIDWSVLSDDELYDLYDALGTEDLTFDEWCEINEF